MEIKYLLQYFVTLIADSGFKFLNLICHWTAKDSAGVVEKSRSCVKKKMYYLEI